MGSGPDIVPFHLDRDRFLKYKIDEPQPKLILLENAEGLFGCLGYFEERLKASDRSYHFSRNDFDAEFAGDAVVGDTSLFVSKVLQNFGSTFWFIVGDDQQTRCF